MPLIIACDNLKKSDQVKTAYASAYPEQSSHHKENSAMYCSARSVHSYVVCRVLMGLSENFRKKRLLNFQKWPVRPAS